MNKELYSLVLSPENNCIFVGGELTFSTVNEILAKAEDLFKSIAAWDIDLAEVGRSDSAGLALLVHWMRQANMSNKKIVFHNIPQQMLAIAAASGLDELLPIQ